MKKILLSLLVLALLLPWSTALAAPPADNYCFPSYVPDRCWSFMQWLDNWGKGTASNIAVGLMKGVALVLWLFDRAAVFVFNKSLPDNGWLLDIRTQMLNLFASMMPSLINETAFGANGVMYVALSLSGLLMIVPVWGTGARFVRAEKVMVWGVVLSLLFVAGSFGYDFIGAVEGFRQGMVSSVALGATLPVDKLVLQPMLAGDGDLGFGSSLLTLPSVFDSAYFPAPQTTEVTIAEGGALGLGNANVELPEDLQRRWDVAGSGVFYAFISAMGGWLLLVSGFAYIVLSFAALMLVVFLFAALPLGFFDVGGLVLSNILSRYFQIIVQSLGLAFFLRWLSSGLGYIVEVNTVSNALIWGVVLAVMILIAHVFLNGAVRILLDSGKVFNSVVSSAGANFGGPSVTGRATAAVRQGASSAFGAAASTAGLVSGAAMMMGRPEVAMAAQMVGAGAQSLSSATGQGGGPLAAGNVFVNNGMAAAMAMQGMNGAAVPPLAPAGQPAQSGTQAAPPVTPPTPARPDPLQSASAFYAAAARNQWDSAQMSQVQSIAQSAPSPDVAVGQLQKAPGFERVSSDDLTRAVHAAREMKPAPAQPGAQNGEGNKHG